MSLPAFQGQDRKAGYESRKNEKSLRAPGKVLAPLLGKKQGQAQGGRMKSREVHELPMQQGCSLFLKDGMENCQPCRGVLCLAGVGGLEYHGTTQGAV